MSSFQGLTQRWKRGGGGRKVYVQAVGIFLEKDRNIHIFLATAKIFTYFWGSTKFLIQWC